MQWRICFEWPEGAAGPSNVEIVDYPLKEAKAVTRPPIHPGKILADELAEIGITPTELARQLQVPPNRMSQIISGKRAITGDTALRLGHWFRNNAQFWLNLQSAYDLRMAERDVGKEIDALPVMPKGSKLKQPSLF
jgi:addiction module HigA family antidote